MRKIIPIFAAFLCIAVWISCSRRDEEEVDKAALAYYTCLVEGRYEDFVSAIAYSDSMTDGYRSQMVDLTAQYAAREKELRGGLVSVRVLGDTVAGDVANVFLEVTFGDSTREEVALPMVKCGEVWKMQ